MDSRNHWQLLFISLTNVKVLPCFLTKQFHLTPHHLFWNTWTLQSVSFVPRLTDFLAWAGKRSADDAEPPEKPLRLKEHEPHQPSAVLLEKKILFIRRLGHITGSWSYPVLWMSQQILFLFSRCMSSFLLIPDGSVILNPPCQGAKRGFIAAFF